MSYTPYIASKSAMCPRSVLFEVNQSQDFGRMVVKNIPLPPQLHGEALEAIVRVVAFVYLEVEEPIPVPFSFARRSSAGQELVHDS